MTLLVGPVTVLKPGCLASLQPHCYPALEYGTQKV